MKNIAKRICSMLESEDLELACSAARVLSNLNIKDKTVRKSLVNNLSRSNDRLRLLILDCLQNHAPREALNELFALYRSGGLVGERAGKVISSVGASALPLLKKEYAKSGFLAKKSIITLAAQNTSDSAADFLISSLKDTNLDLLKHTCYKMRKFIDKLKPAQQSKLNKKILQFLKDKKVAASDKNTVSGIIILGNIGDKNSLNFLLKHIDSKYPFLVRRNALYSLSKLKLEGSASAEMLKRLWPLLNHDDFNNVVRVVLDILNKVKLSKPYLKKCDALLDSEHPSVKAYAIRQIGKTDSTSNVKNLVGHLFAADIRTRESAQESLKQMSLSVPLVIKKLDEVENIEGAERIAAILAANRKKVSKDKLKKIFDKFSALLKKNDEKYKNYLAVLKKINPDFLYKNLLNKAVALKNKKRFAQAVKTLNTVSGTFMFTNEMKYQLAVCQLKLSKKDVSLISRNNDQSLNLLSGLVKNTDMDLAKRLGKERKLRPEDIYYAGFHFSERLFDLKEFGIKLLKRLVKKSPGSKYGKMAKKKISIVGTASKTREFANV